MSRRRDPVVRLDAKDAHLLATEEEWQTFVVEFAEAHGWYCWHDNDPRRNKGGWPDLVLLRPGSAIFAELKTETGRVSTAQRDMCLRLHHAGLETYVWRPSDRARVMERLARR